MIRAVLFDAMDTIVNIDPPPTERDRIQWMYDSSPMLHGQISTDALVELYRRARRAFDDRVSTAGEYTITELLSIVAEDLVTLTDEMGKIGSQMLMRSLVQTYSDAYFRRCTMTAATKSVIRQLSRAYLLAVVSNHIVPGGLSAFLRQEGVLDYFSTVVVSSEVGHRKPHPAIYRRALETLCVRESEAVFVGDHPELDYRIPCSIGLRAILFTGSSTTNLPGFRSVSAMQDLPEAIRVIQSENYAHE